MQLKRKISGNDDKDKVRESGGKGKIFQRFINLSTPNRSSSSAAMAMATTANARP